MPCPGRVGVATDTTGVANDWADWELFILWFCRQTGKEFQRRQPKLPDHTNKQTNKWKSFRIFLPIFRPTPPQQTAVRRNAVPTSGEEWGKLIT